MRTDPRVACANSKELWGWAFLHDLIAHPLMALTNYSRASLRFHDWTSFHAWPRAVLSQGAAAVWMIPSRFGDLEAIEVAPRCWRVKHPAVDHAIVLGADDAVAAAEQAEAWFQTLADEFGGRFAPREGGAP